MPAITERYLRGHRVTHEGNVWTIDAKIWPPSGNRPGLLKVYRIHGDITSPDLVDALRLEADTLGLIASMP